jgi:hypothetical protein
MSASIGMRQYPRRATLPASPESGVKDLADPEKEIFSVSPDYRS